MEISTKRLLDGSDGLAICLARIAAGVGRVTVASVLAAVLEAQNENRLHNMDWRVI